MPKIASNPAEISKSRAKKNVKKAWKRTADFFEKNWMKWNFLKSSNWTIFINFWVIWLIESAKNIYIHQTFQIWNLQRAPRRSRARKLSWKKSDKIDSVFFMHYLLKIMNLCMCTRLRAPLISALKSLINVDVCCTLNRWNISKMHEISTKSFSTQNSKSSKFGKITTRFFRSKWISYKLFDFGWTCSMHKLWSRLMVQIAYSLL